MNATQPSPAGAEAARQAPWRQHVTQQHAQQQDAARELAGRMLDWAQRRVSAPALLLGAARGFVEWAHYPQPDAIDPVSGWKFYYHAHAASQRLYHEHGHFHVFLPAGHDLWTHWIGLTLDRRGLPLRLFTTNRWVTDEAWRSSGELAGEHPRLRDAAPTEVGAWLESLLCVYADDVAQLQRERDLRLAGRGLDDHRLRIPSQCRVNLLERLQALGVQ